MGWQSQGQIGSRFQSGTQEKLSGMKSGQKVQEGTWVTEATAYPMLPKYTFSTCLALYGL